MIDNASIYMIQRCMKKIFLLIQYFHENTEFYCGKRDIPANHFSLDSFPYQNSSPLFFIFSQLFDLKVFLPFNQ